MVDINRIMDVIVIQMTIVDNMLGRTDPASISTAALARLTIRHLIKAINGTLVDVYGRKFPSHELNTDTMNVIGPAGATYTVIRPGLIIDGKIIIKINVCAEQKA